MGHVDGHVHLLPLGVVEVLPDHEALELGDEVGVQVQLPVAQLEAEVRVALADGHQPVTWKRREIQISSLFQGLLGPKSFLQPQINTNSAAFEYKSVLGRSSLFSALGASFFLSTG